MRLIKVSLASALALGVLGSLAVADISKYRDRKGDSTGGDATDIRQVADGHAGANFKHVVRVVAANRFTRRQTSLFIRSEGANYNVSTRGVYTAGPMRTGNARVTRDGDRIILKFRPSAIGSPGHSYRWQAFTAAPDHEPFDRAPNRGKYRHALVGG